jgi:DNA recombination protein RmuC
MSSALSVVAIALLVLAVFLLALLLLRQRKTSADIPLREMLQGQDRGERLLREEMGRSRQEAAQNSQQVREDVARSIKGLGDSTVNSIGQIGLQQKGQFDTFAQQLAALTESNEGA